MSTPVAEEMRLNLQASCQYIPMPYSATHKIQMNTYMHIDLAQHSPHSNRFYNNNPPKTTCAPMNLGYPKRGGFDLALESDIMFHEHHFIGRGTQRAR